MRQFHFGFFRFFGSDFLNDFPTSLIVRSGSSCFWTKIPYLASGFFLFTWDISTLIFSFFYWIFFSKWFFLISSYSVLGLVCCLVNENSLNCTSGLVLLCFFTSLSPSMILTTWLFGIDFFNDFSDFNCFAVKICILDVISAFRSIEWLTSLKKLTSEFTHGTSYFMNFY